MKTDDRAWEVVVWYSGRPLVRGFETREEAFSFGRSHFNADAIEVYGPGGFYEAS